MKPNPAVLLLKGNGPISINNELLELYAATTCHGAIGFPLKSLRADNVCIVNDLEHFWVVEKEILDKPICFVYAYEPLSEEDLRKIHTPRLRYIS